MADTSFVLVLTNSIAVDILLVSTEMLVVIGVNELVISMVVASEGVVPLVLSSEVDSTLVVDGTENTGTLDLFSGVLALDDTVDTGEVVVLEDAFVDVEGDDVVSETVVVGSLDCELVASEIDSAGLDVTTVVLDEVGTAADEAVVTVVMMTLDCSNVVASVVDVIALGTSSVNSVLDCTEENGKLLVLN